MKTPSEIISEFIDSLGSNPKVDKKVTDLLKGLNQQGKLTQKNLREAVDRLIDEGMG